MKMARWFHHEAPWVDGVPTTYRREDRLNHAVFGQQSEEAREEAQTVCGKPADQIPGRGDVVDCQACIEATTKINTA